VIFEDCFDVDVERRILIWIAEQIADHPDVIGVGKSYDRDDVRTRAAKCWMNRVPGSNPTEETAAARDFVPSEVEATAFVADGLGTPLECAAIVTSLDDEFVPFGSFPIFFIESAPLRARSGETVGQIVFFFFGHEYRS
jgi:hypothetical protein